MAKTKKLQNHPKTRSDLRESDISRTITNESSSKSRGTANENRDDVTDQEISARDGSQGYARPKGMDA